MPVKVALRQSIISTFLGVALLFGLDAFAAQAPQEFQVEGVLHTKGSSPSAAHRVQVNYKGGQWAIREIAETNVKDASRWPANLTIPNVTVNTLSSDGTNIYYVAHYETNSITSASFEHPNAISNNLIAAIYAPGFPDGLPHPSMAILFYAYLSTQYLNSVTNDLLDPIRLGYGAGRVPAIYKRMQDSVGLPSEIVFFDEEGKRTNAILQSSNLGSRSGIVLPKRVVVTMFASFNGEPVATYDFEATVLRDKCGSIPFRPDLTTGAYVNDCRFSRGAIAGPVPAISYGIRTNWPTEAEGELRARNFFHRWNEHSLAY
jgi:hypothetical protein